MILFTWQKLPAPIKSDVSHHKHENMKILTSLAFRKYFLKNFRKNIFQMINLYSKKYFLKNIFQIFLNINFIFRKIFEI